MLSNREALIGKDHFVANESETTEAFHRRIKDIAKGRGVMFVKLGDHENAKAQRKAAPYPQAGEQALVEGYLPCLPLTATRPFAVRPVSYTRMQSGEDQEAVCGRQRRTEGLPPAAPAPGRETGRPASG